MHIIMAMQKFSLSMENMSFLKVSKIKIKNGGFYCFLSLVNLPGQTLIFFFHFFEII